MNKSERKNIFNIFYHELKYKLKSTIICSIILFLVMTLYMGLFHEVQSIMSDKFNDLPKELLAFFGINDAFNMSNYNYYFAMVYKIILTIFIGYTCVQATSSLHDEEKTGTIEFLNSQCVNRTEIVFGKYLSVIVNTLIITIFMTIPTIFFGYSIGSDTFSFQAITLSTLITIIPNYIFISIGFLVASLTGKNIKAFSITLSIFFGCYLFGYIANIGVESVEFLKYLSPIDFINPNDIITSNLGIGVDKYNFLPMIVGIVLTIICFTLSIIFYKKKDL